MGEFRISPALKIGQECFNTRKIRNCKGRVCEGYYLVSLKDCMMLSKKDDEGIREKFWNYVEQSISEVYGDRSKSRRPYKKEHGCYIFTWGTTPIYIGQTSAVNGFMGECFADHKKKKIKSFLSDKNFISSKKTKNSFLNLYLIFWDGKQNANLKDIVVHMETTLIMKAIEAGFYGNLYNERKTSYKWVIEGYNDECKRRTLSKSNCIEMFKNIFNKHPRKSR